MGQGGGGYQRRPADKRRQTGGAEGSDHVAPFASLAREAVAFWSYSVSHPSS